MPGPRSFVRRRRLAKQLSSIILRHWERAARGTSRLLRECFEEPGRDDDVLSIVHERSRAFTSRWHENHLVGRRNKTGVGRLGDDTDPPRHNAHSCREIVLIAIKVFAGRRRKFLCTRRDQVSPEQRTRDILDPYRIPISYTERFSFINIRTHAL